VQLLYPTLLALLVLLVFVVFVGLQHRDLLRADAYGEFVGRLAPLLLSGVLILGLPFVLRLTSADDALSILLLYLAGTAALAAFTARRVAPEERRAAALFRAGEYEAAAGLYERLAARKPLARYHSARAASLDASGDPHGALAEADLAVEMDSRLGTAYYNRASALAALGERTRARADLQSVFRADSGSRLRRAAEEALEGLGKG
jgi:lipoprotein NlpI